MIVFSFGWVDPEERREERDRTSLFRAREAVARPVSVTSAGGISATSSGYRLHSSWYVEHSSNRLLQ
jgi:hypothetical protein